MILKGSEMRSALKNKHRKITQLLVKENGENIKIQVGKNGSKCHFFGSKVRLKINFKFYFYINAGFYL